MIKEIKEILSKQPNERVDLSDVWVFKEDEKLDASAVALFGGSDALVHAGHDFLNLEELDEESLENVYYGVLNSTMTDEERDNKCLTDVDNIIEKAWYKISLHVEGLMGILLNDDICTNIKELVRNEIENKLE